MFLFDTHIYIYIHTPLGLKKRIKLSSANVTQGLNVLQKIVSKRFQSSPDTKNYTYKVKRPRSPDVWNRKSPRNVLKLLCRFSNN